MTRSRKLVAVGTFLLLHPFLASAQPIPYSPEVRAVVYREHGAAVGGFVRSINDSSITIWDDTLIRINRSTIDSLTFLPRMREHPGGLIGLFTSSYLLGNAIFGSVGQPFGYLRKREILNGDIILCLAGIGAGALLGHGIDGEENDNADMSVNLTDTDRAKSWEHVVDIIDAPNRSPMIHFGLYTGWIIPRSEYVLEHYATASGLREVQSDRYIYSGANFYTPLDSVNDAFNLLRRGELLIDVWHAPTYQLCLQAGISFVQLGEPTVAWFRDSAQTTLAYLRHSTQGTGYFLEMASTYHLGEVGRGVDLSGGLGIGLADMIVDRAFFTQLETATGPSHDTAISYHAAWKSMSQLFFIQVRANLSRSFSLGLYADAVFVPAQHAEPLPLLNIPAYDLHYGNASAGFSVGFNF